MTSSRIHQPDTQADRQLKECLSNDTRKSFIVVAGAGSGKTTSLVKALSSIVEMHGLALKRKRQKVACITYTEIAAKEIWEDVGSNSLVHVSTIHSFMWMLVRSFQSDIHAWVKDRITTKVAELRHEAENFGPRVRERTREKNRLDIERYEREFERLDSVATFTYGTGSNYPKGLLGHDDVLKLTTEFLHTRPLFRMLLAQQFPFVFVDESQDTTEAVVSALKAVNSQMPRDFCLGFFGDPMQQIYPTGIGEIKAEDDWVKIPKPENFRCAKSILDVANAIRRDGDDLEQTRGRMVNSNGTLQSVHGTARIFVLPADDNRDLYVDRVRKWIAKANNDVLWQPIDTDVFDVTDPIKTLVIVHRMAANRLGFGDLYTALNDKAPEAFKNGFFDASAWPVRSLTRFVLPLCDAIRNGREFEAISLLREHSDLLKAANLKGKKVDEVLKHLHNASCNLEIMLRREEQKTIEEVLVFLRDSELTALDPRILAHLDNALPPEDDKQGGDNEQDDIDPEEADKEVMSMASLLACKASQLWGYARYVSTESPFSTQQGIKGSEFPRVLVVLDDEEGTHNQYSYDKYFGIKKPSKRDLKNIDDGRETSIERTRRLFYVCCTRALEDLAVIHFSKDPAFAEECVKATKIFPENSILTLEALN